MFYGMPPPNLSQKNVRIRTKLKEKKKYKKGKSVSSSKPKNSDIVWHHTTVTRERRQQQNAYKSVVLRFTSLSGEGKSTLAHAVEEDLHLSSCWCRV